MNKEKIKDLLKEIINLNDKLHQKCSLLKGELIKMKINRGNIAK